MSSERNLISKILAERDLSVCAERGVTSKFFLDPDHRAAYESITEHHLKYGLVPTVETFKKDYPAYRLPDADDSMAFYVDDLSADYMDFLLEEGIAEVIDLYEADDTDQAKDAMARTLTVMNKEVSGSRVSDLTENSADRMERYKAYAKMDGSLKGISSGFWTIDQATGGFQPQQLITMVGPPKAGKSTIMLISDIAAHQGFYRPLFVGFEMSNEEQEERHDSIRAGVSHERLRKGSLTAKEIQKMERMMRRLEGMPPLIFSEDATANMTLSGIAAQLDKHNPDVLYVDGVYMMEDENGERKGSPQAITNITRGFKMMAKNFNIPIVISTQVLEWKMDRKKGVTSSSIGYSSSFFQDSDVLIGVEKTDDEDVNKVKILDGRNVKRMETFVRWDWETGSFEEMEEGEYEGEDAGTPQDPKF